MAKLGSGKQQSLRYLNTNIPFWHKHDPEESITSYKLDYRALCARKPETVSKPKLAQILPKDQTHIREADTEAATSYKAHPVQPRAQISRWTKLTTNFKMPTSSGHDTFVTSNSAFQPEASASRRLQPTGRANLRGSSLKLGHIGLREPPRSTHQDSYPTPHSSSVDRRAALGPDLSIPTLKGDGRLHTYESLHKSVFEPKPLATGQTAVKSQHRSAVTLGDKRTCERQTTHSASFTRPKVYSSPVPTTNPQFRLGHTSTQSWSCTSREAYGQHTADPVVHVRKSRNLSSVPKGDMDPRRVQERLSHTASSIAFTEMKPKKRPETDAGLMTRSNVHFSPASLQAAYYSTTNAEHYTVRGGAERDRPAFFSPSDILSGPDQGPNLSITQEDYVSLPVSKPLPSSSSQHMTNIKFPVAAVLYTTTHCEAYTPKSSTPPPPAQSQLSSHILMQ